MKKVNSRALCTVFSGTKQQMQRLNSAHGGVAVNGTARKLAQQQKSLHQQSQIGTVPQLLAGGIAGALSKTCTTPLARLTILLQVQNLYMHEK